MQNIVHAETSVLITIFRFLLEKTYFLRQIVSIAKIDKARQDKSGVREAGIKLET
jgi:hypothetical protein